MSGTAQSRLYRRYPVGGVAQTLTVVGGQTFNVAAGSYIDVPQQYLPYSSTAFVGSTMTGPTSARPQFGVDPDFMAAPSSYAGFVYCDTSLGYDIRWNGANWTNYAGASV